MEDRRHAMLFDNYSKEGDGVIVTVHGFFQIGDAHDGYGPCVLVELENGELEEHNPSRIRFLKEERLAT